MLDEALSVLEFAYQGDKPRGLRVAREAIQSYLDTLAAACVTPASDEPPAPSLTQLESAGLALASQKMFEARSEEVSAWRLLWALVKRSGWEWSQVKDAAQPNRAEASAADARNWRRKHLYADLRATPITTCCYVH